MALGGALLIVGAFAYLLYGGIDSNVVYFLTPHELLAKGTRGIDVPLRLGGQVKPGSVQWNASTLALHFVVTDGMSEVGVTAHGAPPQMFRDGMGVVLEGRFHADGEFACTNLMVRHSNEYRPPRPGTTPRQMARTLVGYSGS